MDRHAGPGHRLAPALLALCLGAALLVGAPADALVGSGSWNHVGADGPDPALDGHVYAMHAEGNLLYVGGRFLNAGGVGAADRIATWDGTSWHAIGTSPISNTGDVRDIEVDGDIIYAGGTFLNAGGDPNADFVARYDGVSWEPFCNAAGPAFAGEVRALQIVDETLYIGGSYQNAGNLEAADYLVGCDLSTGVLTATVSSDGDATGPIYDLTATSDGTLVAGGSFTNMDQIPAADFVATYDGSWSSLGPTPVGGIVRSVEADLMDIYVASDGLDIGGEARADHIVQWNGMGFVPVGSNGANTNGYFPTTAYIYALETAGPFLYAAGSWLNADGKPTGDNFAYFDGTTWRPLGSNGASPPNGALNSTVEALSNFKGQVYAGGAMTSAGGDPRANFLASRSLRLPDAAIAGPSGGFTGRNVYNSNAAGQSETISIPRGSSKTFRVVIGNDGILPASFTLKGAAVSTGHNVTFFDTSVSPRQNITNAVKNGTYDTPLLARGSEFPMDVVVSLTQGAANTGKFTVKATGQPRTPVDVVKGIVDAT